MKQSKCINTRNSSVPMASLGPKEKVLYGWFGQNQPSDGYEPLKLLYFVRWFMRGDEGGGRILWPNAQGS